MRSAAAIKVERVRPETGNGGKEKAEDQHDDRGDDASGDLAGKIDVEPDHDGEHHRDQGEDYFRAHVAFGTAERGGVFGAKTHVADRFL